MAPGVPGEKKRGDRSPAIPRAAFPPGYCLGATSFLIEPGPGDSLPPPLMISTTADRDRQQVIFVSLAFLVGRTSS